MGLIKATRFNELQNKVETECCRRTHLKSVDPLIDYTYLSYPAEKDQKISQNHYTELSNPIRDINIKAANLTDNQGRKVIVLDDNTEIKELADGPITERLINKLENSINAYSSVPVDDGNNTGCQAGCTGLCYASCSSYCSGDCINGCYSACT